MKLIAEVLTISFAIFGVLVIIVLPIAPFSKQSVETTRAQSRRRNMIRGGILFWISGFAFVFLITGYATPSETVVSLLGALAIFLPLSFIRAGSTTIAVARDITSGKPLGVIVGRTTGSEELKMLRIRTPDGTLIERPESGVVVEFP